MCLFVLYVIITPWHILQVNVWWQYLCYAIALLGTLILLLAIFQLKSSLSPFPSPTATNQLVDKGVYALARHPIYTGIITTCFFYGLASIDIFKIAIGLLLFVLFYFKARYEEEMLLKKHPSYKSYQQRVNMFLTFPFMRN